jgi:hypothetical protein
LAAKNRHELVEDVEMLLPTDTPERIAERLGRSVSAVARALQHEGRGDLARPFEQVAWQRRKESGWVRPSREEQEQRRHERDRKRFEQAREVYFSLRDRYETA